jgi:putative phosphoribosyl transferase
MVFADRRHAGRALAGELLRLAPEQPIVLALPRGGVPVGFEVARALGAPLDILAVRKLGSPQNPEYGIGATAEDGTTVLDRPAASRVGMSAAELDETLGRETAELRRRVALYRAGRERIDVRGRTVIVVDDGLATGLTDLAAVRALRRLGAGRIVVGVPVGVRESLARIGAEADEVVCLTIPRELLGVGHWYEDFSPVSDEEVVALLDAAQGAERAIERELLLQAPSATLVGDLALPPAAAGLVIFAHGSGSSWFSPRNRAVAAALRRRGLATLLLDLLTEAESRRRELRFDIPLLARRLELATLWALEDGATKLLPIGYFGASTGAAAALRAAAATGSSVRAVVSRGGRPDLAADRLPQVIAPTLLIVGGRDEEVLELNRRSEAMLGGPHRLLVVQGAGHLFEEPGALEQVAFAAGEWFERHLVGSALPQRERSPA